MHTCTGCQLVGSCHCLASHLVRISSSGRHGSSSGCCAAPQLQAARRVLDTVAQRDAGALKQLQRLAHVHAARIDQCLQRLCCCLPLRAPLSKDDDFRPLPSPSDGVWFPASAKEDEASAMTLPLMGLKGIGGTATMDAANEGDDDDDDSEDEEGSEGDEEDASIDKAPG